MPLVVLGTIRTDPDTIINVGYDNESYIADFRVFLDRFSVAPETLDSPIGVACNGTTKVTYNFIPQEPYSEATYEFNSPYCGYTPTICDIVFPNNPVTSDETQVGANDGTVQVYATSSAAGAISYDLNGDVNTIGYFSGLEAGNYTIIATDSKGCKTTIGFTIYAADNNLTSYKYRLAFKSVLGGVDYELRFLDQKKKYDPLLYPKDLIGYDPDTIRYKKANNEEDKTSAFAFSSLYINVLNNGIFTIDEFVKAAERDWKIELYKKTNSPLPQSTFIYTLTEQISGFIDGNVQLKQDGVVIDTLNSNDTKSANFTPNKTYSIEAYVESNPIGANAKIRMTIYSGSTLIYDKQVVATAGASMVKSGLVQSKNYTIQVTTLSTTDSVTEVDIDDNSDPFLLLEWQGWLIPDEIQDLYADPEYPVQLVATDGLASLKGTYFGDLSLSYIDANGIKKLSQMFGLRKIRYLLKICLQQLGYDYGSTTILSSLRYKDYNENGWLNYATWVDIFYDENGISDDVFEVLEKILKSLKLQIFQHKGSFVLWDLNDAYYRNNTTIGVSSKFFESLILFDNQFNVITQAEPPKNDIVGYTQRIQPINPPQNWTFDKAYNRIEANVDFNLLSLLYKNPSFELNAIQGQTPSDLQAIDVSAYYDYAPQDDTANGGAFLGDWQMRVTGKTTYRYSSGAPNAIYFQDPPGFLFSLGSPRWVHTFPNLVIDQPNKKINISFMWRPILLQDQYIPAPRIGIFFTDSTSGKLWAYGGGNQGYNGTGWFEADFEYPFILCSNITTVDDFDFLAWNQFNISTDKLPESGLGAVDIGIGNMTMPLKIVSPFEVDTTIDYDQFIITQSDANNVYNFQKGEKHVVQNVTEYAKAEKKEVELSLFNYPPNKRVGGNLVYGDNYETTQLSNEWYFYLSSEQQPNRLPANVIKRIAKNYQRPMYKWEGEIMADEVDFYCVYSIIGANGVFVPFSIEMDLRNSVGKIVLIEIEDTPTQSSYNYLPIYEKSARNNVS